MVLISDNGQVEGGDHKRFEMEKEYPENCKTWGCILLQLIVYKEGKIMYGKI